ncbi:hypothetical protein [Blastococcus sp. URHD0036]|uniref:hypothetical protein n=1 Tax=Blastococcus sp. URHD0036 TaxID=1380356 RepID=UPI00054CEEF3|nr:hypothetical protein [Blastococcus sp. URHD0036]
MTDATEQDEFGDPYVDVQEERSAPVAHTYVHGGFRGTETRFSLYFPPAGQYEGRFFQHVTPVPLSEHLAQSATGEQDTIGFAVSSGAYFVETNGGGEAGRPGSAGDPTVAAYRANAAAARYSRGVAARLYGEHRPYGYLYGGSGGAFRTIGGAENTTGVWDGVVPFVPGSPVAIPNVFTVRMHAQRVLRSSLDRIVDALEPGGSGDPSAGLTDEERAALAEVTRMGFPPRSWFGHRTMGIHAFEALYPGLLMADAAYFTDFWTEPGYEGADPASSVHRDRVDHPAEVVAVVDGGAAERLGLPVERDHGGNVDTAWAGSAEAASVPVAVRLSAVPAEVGSVAELVVDSGAAAGVVVGPVRVAGDAVVLPAGSGSRLAGLRPGDAVRVDNARLLAAQTYHRHQDPGPDFAVWDQFREPDGTPRYPQRPLLLGPLFTQFASGVLPTGRFAGKMIVVASLLDREAFPWQADWYRAKAREHLGDAADDSFRLWYVDSALHNDDEVQEDPTHTVSYLGVLHRALRDLAAWVERGESPPATTAYEVADGQVLVPATAGERHGVQPVVTLTADGGARAEVAVGQDVVLRAVAEAPDGGDDVVGVEWDLDGRGEFVADETAVPGRRVGVERRHAFATPGTRFLTVRVTAQPAPDAGTSFARIRALARVRVVVS